MTDFSIEQLGSCRFLSPFSKMLNIRYLTEAEQLLFRAEVDVTPQGIAPADETTLELAGPREQLFFDPAKVRAAIVTCGGLCPGLNAVIRGLVMQLWHIYGAQDILGLRYGYHGLGNNAVEPLTLTPDGVNGIKGEGGTILGSSRGTPPTAELVDNLLQRKVDLLFVIGGDGSMRGADALWAEIKRRGLNIAVVGIPKTIDNDIPFVRRTFGFDTAVAEAMKAINVAEVEARGMPNGVGIVKLMGRHAGFIAATACVASGQANFCLVPELKFGLAGKGGLLNLLKIRLQTRGHAVIVVAEGAGQELVERAEYDASGNKKLGDIGPYLKQAVQDYFAAQSITCGIKYIEPSYLIRSAPPTASDQIYCDQLARVAVHAAMAGKTGMLIGNWNGRLVHIPFSALNNHQQRLNPEGELWFSVRENTGQPQVIG